MSPYFCKYVHCAKTDLIAGYSVHSGLTQKFVSALELQRTKFVAGNKMMDEKCENNRKGKMRTDMQVPS